jgi:peptidoglycan/LPS O-acetylase OafA/YrhL
MVESIELKKQANFRLVFLDFIRGIAALAVFFQHAAPNFFSQDWFNLGKFGVVLFFLVSGFIIPFSLERGGSARKFWMGRFFRLYPLYWTSLVCIVTLAILGSPSVPENFRTNLVPNFLVNLTMFQDFVGVPPALGVYETLTLELVFYIACTILFLLQLHRKSYVWAWGVLGLTVFGSVLVPLGLEKRLPMAAMFYILSMFVGTVLYRCYSKVVTKRQVVQLLVAVFCVAVAGIYINYVLYQKGAGEDHYTFLSVLTAWVMGYAFFLGVFTLRDQVFPQVFSWLGKISYSVYLLHPIVLGVTPQFGFRPLWVAVTLVGTLILANATYHFIEHPSVEFGRKLQKKILVLKQGTSPSLGK